MPEFNEQTDLKLERELNAPIDLVWRGWTEPENLKEWWCPRPWRAVECEIELKPGGRFYTLMRAPDGGDGHAVEGCYLEVVDRKRLVFTIALTRGFRPASIVGPVPPFTAVAEFEDLGSGKTLYRARVMHRNDAERDAHAAMGFEHGWAIAAQQLEEWAGLQREAA